MASAAAIGEIGLRNIPAIIFARRLQQDGLHRSSLISAGPKALPGRLGFGGGVVMAAHAVGARRRIGLAL